MKKIEKAAEVAREYIGNPYIFGALGQACTPDFRRTSATRKPDYAEKIKKYCQVLSGKKNSCAGCKYEGKPAFDCRGLTFESCKRAGISISSTGATTQWNNDGDWIEKGLIADMPQGSPCIVFKKNGDKMQHTGFYIGDGYVIDARGHAYGVVISPLSDYPWTHYAIPKGAYDDYDPALDRPTLRTGSRGESVAELQEILSGFGFDLPTYGADGIFGEETKNAVIAFQIENLLTPDGVVGAKTWAAIEKTLKNFDESETLYNVTIPRVDAETATYLIETYEGASAAEV